MPALPVQASIALGSNMGDKIMRLREAKALIAALPQTRILAGSNIYRTPPWGMVEQDWFANAVIKVETSLSPHALLDACLGIEKQMGRKRMERWGPRIIDLDVLSYGDARLCDERLTLPHPAMAERAFVLIPLRDVAPDMLIDGQELEALIAKQDSHGIEAIALL